jgi:hypothetical protein
MFVQLNPPIPVFVVGRGKGCAIAVIDYGQEHNLIWVTAMDASGEIWCAPNPSVRLQTNWTMGRQPAPVVDAPSGG